MGACVAFLFLPSFRLTITSTQTSLPFTLEWWLHSYERTSRSRLRSIKTTLSFVLGSSCWQRGSPSSPIYSFLHHCCCLVWCWRRDRTASDRGARKTAWRTWVQQSFLWNSPYLMDLLHSMSGQRGSHSMVVCIELIVIFGGCCDMRTGTMFGPCITMWYRFLNKIRFASPTRALVYRVRFCWLGTLISWFKSTNRSRCGLTKLS